MAGSATVTHTHSNGGHFKISVAWTSDASGNVSGTSIPFSGLLYRVVTIPSATAPTANYDITLADPDSNATVIDAMQGLTQNRSATAAEAIYFSGVAALTSGPAIHLSGEYALSIASAGNAKSGTINFYGVSLN